MKIVKVKGFGKFNKAVEDEIDKLLVEEAKKQLERFIRQAWLAFQNPDEMAFAE